MRIPYVTADVFTGQRFEGNPLAVVLEADALTSAQMQTIAIEFAYSETTFVLRPREAAHTAHVRIFTPSAEIPFAGHPNIGTAFVIARALEATGQALPDRFVFEEAAGLVPVRLLHDGGRVTGAELTVPEALSRRAAVTEQQAADCLGLSAQDVQSSAHPPHVISVGLPFLVVELASREALRRARPNPVGLGQVLPLDGATAVYAYTREAAGADIEARMFTSRMTEDPATGSATAATAALLAALRGGADLDLRVRQGVDMGRPSLLLAGVRHGDGAVTVHVGGACVAVMEGVLLD